MLDFADARRKMVDGQIRTSDVTDLRLIAAFLAVPRERFVPDRQVELAYLDVDLPVFNEHGVERRLLKPMVLAKLIQAAAIGANDHVLDVGCATGYSSAVLGRLARSVVGLEQNADLARAAEVNLRAAGIGNVTVVGGSLSEGWPADGPYDAIILNGATEVVPKSLLRQLKDGGRLAGIVGRVPASSAMLYRAAASEVSGRPIFDAVAPLLPGFAEPPAFVF